ncbi:MAG TPA: hypothetical protein VJA46_06305 [Acidimicrobiia bacterium]|nr:hypothetical protein [Acidimicrobiia bacterium]
MSDNPFRDVARAGLAPLVEDLPDSPEWEQIAAVSAPIATQPSRNLPGWTIALVSAAAVVTVLGLGFLRLGGPPPVTLPGVAVPFDVERAASEGETWWSAVIAGDVAGAVAAGHPEGQFNFEGLEESVNRLGEPVTFSVGREVFGSEQQPLLCFALRGPNTEFTGALVYRQSDQQWLVWEVRPDTEGCLVANPSTTTTAQTTTSSTDATPTTVPDQDTGIWERLEPAPIAGRRWHSTTWTGQELIVWGGGIPFGGAFGDGAAFDPASREWRELAPSPLRARVGHTAVWTGDEVIIWGGHGGGDSSHPDSWYFNGAVYNPSTDSWRQIADSPLTGGPGYSAVWTGSEMIVMGGNDGYRSAAENGLSEAAAYNPSTDSWRPIELPSPMLMIDAVWTGTEVVFYGVQGYLGELVGFSYNPLTDVFRDIPASPISPAMPDIELVGNRVLVWGYDPEVEGIAALDLVTEEWQLLPSFPGQPSDGTPNAVALGLDQILFQSETLTAVYSFPSGDWEMIPPSTNENASFDEAPIWTGEEALFYIGGSGLWAYVPDNGLDP